MWILATVSLLVIAFSVYYIHWLRTQMARISLDSNIVQTKLGQVEYNIQGDGPVVLHLHGSTSGHNGWFLLEHLIAAGYCLLSPDRPGYLGTPLKNNGSPEAQADLAAALLETLDIDQVAVVGISGGGPAALQFALRHPQRTQALLMLSAIAKGARHSLSKGIRSSC